jgi:hypothetical protein
LDDGGGSQASAKRSPKESIRKFAGATTRSVRDKVNAKSVLSSFIRTALPDGYTRLLGLYDETAAGIQSVVDGVEETEFAALEKLAAKFEDQLPKLKGKLPDAVYERIKGKLEDKKEDYSLRRQIGDAQAARKKGDYDEKGESLAVDQMFDQLQMAEAQLDMDKASSDVEHNKLDYDVKRDGIRARLDKTRFDVLNRHLGMIADSTQRNVAYNDSVTYQYQKKSLELQMRSYLATRSLVKLTNESLTLHKQAYTALVHNTGLPEFLKASEAERTKFYIKEQMRNPFLNKIAQTASEASANFLPALFNNIGSKAAGGVRAAGNAGQGGLGMLLKTLMQNPEDAAGGLAGDQIASFLHSSVIPSIARRARPGMKKVSDKLTGGGDSRIAYLLDNMASMSQDFANDAKNSTGMKGQLQKMVKMFAPQFRVNDLAKTGTYQTINQPAQFNQMTQRSIVEVIPGYLARILQETRMIRTGDDSIGREVFDITRGNFVQEKKSQDNLAKRVVGGNARRSVKYSLNSAVDGFTEDGSVLSPEARHALEERLLRDAMEGKHFDPVTYVKPEGYAPGTSAAVLAELTEFFKKQFKFSEDGQLAKSTANFTKRQEFSTKFNDLRDTVRNPMAEIERIMASGNTTQLRDLGIVHIVEGEDRINFAVLRELYRDLGDPSASGEPPPMPSPTGPLLSKLRKRLREGNEEIKKRSGRVRARVRGLGDRAKGALSDMEGPDVTAVTEAFNASKAQALVHADDVAKRATDLMIAGKEGVVIKASEILSGELIDVTTQKVIGRVEDIKGEVIDITGRVRLTRADVAQGLVNGEGRVLDLLKHLPKGIPPSVMSMLHGQRQQIGNLITAENGAMSRVKDLYLEGANDPVIKASGLRAGEYIDVATKKVLETIDDISGAVVRKDRPDEVLFTTEEAAEKLVDNSGKRFKSSKILKYLAWATGKSFSITAGMASIGLAVARKIGMFVAKKLTGLDAYLPPGREPILTTSKLKRGEYYNEDGSVIKSFDDLRDGVYTADGNLLVDPDDIPNLINRDGTKHTAAKHRSKIRKIAKKIAGLPMAAAKGIGKFWWKQTKAYYKGMGNMVANKFGKSKANAQDYNDKFITPTDGLLGQMLNLLDKRLPKEAAKEGSWQDKLQEAEAAAKAKKEGTKAERANRKKEAGGGLLGGLAKLLGRGKKDDEEEEGGGDTNIDLGGGEGGEGNDRKKNRKVRKKPRGKLGRGWDKLANTKLGKGVGRFGGNALMRGGGTAARLAGTGARVAGSALLGGLEFGALGLGGLASGAASMAGTGLAMAGSAAAAAGTAILGVLASPVVLGALAVGAVAAGGYWLWNRSNKVSGDFRELRLMQYGIDSTSDKLKILELEAYLETFSQKGAEPSLNVSGTDPKKIFEIMDIDEDEPESIVRMARWLELRFKPVFFAWLRAMHQLTPTGVAINELDDKLPDEAKYDFFNIVKTVPNTVYAQLGNPLDEDPIEITAEDINAKVTELIDKWKDKAKAKDEQKTGDTTGATAIVPPGGSKPEDKDKPKADGADKPKDAEKSSAWYSIKAGAKGLMGAVPGAAAIGGLISAVKEDWFGKMFSGASTAAKIVATPALLGGMVLKSAVMMVGAFKADKLTTLQAVRVRAYGRMQLDEKTISALFESEAELYKQVRYDTEGQAYYDGNLDQLIGTMANIFGVDVTDATSRKAQEFTAWILQRFIPTGLAYFAAVKQKGNAITPSRVETALDDDAKLSVANALMVATYEMNGEQISVWKANTFFNNGTSSLDALKAAAEKETAVLKEAAAKAKLASPGTSVKEQENQEKTQARTTAEKIMDGVSNLGDSLKEKFSSFADGVKESIGGAVNSVKDFLGMGPGGKNAQTPAPSAYNTAYTPGGTLEQKGSTYSAFAEGNGGAWNSIPLPKSNKSREAAMETLRAIQAMTGVDAELLATFASMESNFDYTVKAGTSSATGWFQFIDKTWDGMLKEHASKYGIPPDNKDRYLRKDPRINGLMGAEFLKGNYKILAKALGRAPTDTDLYFAHFLGPQTAAGFLKRDRNAIAASFYPDQAGANRSIFYKSTGQPRTIGEVYDIFDGKVRKHRKGGGGTDVGTATTAVDPQKAADEQAKAVQASADIKPPADPVTGEVGTNPTGGNPNDSLNMTADKAAAPMRMGDPSQAGQGGGGTAPSGGSNPTVGSGQDLPERKQAMDEAMQKAAAGDKARQAANQEKQALSATSMDLMQEQLTTQQQMRDLLKTIADKLGSPVQAAPAAPAPASSKSGNDMGNQQAQAGRQAGNAPTPISFAR